MGHISGGHLTPAVFDRTYGGGRFKSSELPDTSLRRYWEPFWAGVLYLIASGAPGFQRMEALHQTGMRTLTRGYSLTLLDIRSSDDILS
ncbi:MAG: hypothetical protein IPJ20_14900 [Flammeovirgaceae bacterium]|nr:hypothetical protein [Flammeovirgaceae bacterium]